MVNIWDKITNKNYHISSLVIILSLLLLESTVSGYITKYISLNGVVLSFVSMFLILTLARLISEEILEL